MGLGKTVQVIVALTELRLRGEARRSLIVVPASLRSNWVKELRTWSPAASVALVQGSESDRRSWYLLPFHIHIASYDQIRSDFFVYPPDIVFDVVVLDEAQRAKDPTSATAIAVARIARKRTWLLTATPLENQTTDLETLVRLMNFGRLPRHPSRERVHEALQGRFLRRHKADVLRELPPILEQEVEINLLPNQRAAYDRAWQEGRSNPVAKNYAAMLALITRLKKLCNYDEDSNESAKLDALQDIVDAVRAEGGKLLLFSQYVETLTWLAPKIRLKSFLFHGSLRAPERDSILQAFADAEDSVALLVSLKAGGVGLNIPDATHVVLFDRWWNPSVEDQAVARAHRFGRQLPLTAFRFLVVDSVEERIRDILHDKRDLFSEYVEDAPNLHNLDADALRTILRFE